MAVHGLLGQNAIDPPTRFAPAPRCTALRDGRFGGLSPASGPEGASAAATATAGGVRLDDTCDEPEGHQGEGFIDGSYLDYEVNALEEHEHGYSRLSC